MTIILGYTLLTDVAVILFGLFGLIVLYLVRDVDQWPTGLCAAILVSSIARTLLDLAIDDILQSSASAESIVALRAAVALIAPVPSFLMFAFFLWSCGEDWRTSKSVRILAAIVGALSVSSTLATLTRGTGEAAATPPAAMPWAILSTLLVAATVSFILISILKRWSRLSVLQRVLFPIAVIATSSTQIIVVELILTSYLVSRLREQREEAERQHLRAAILQMRPHFIHNTLASIHYLCAKDAVKAQQVILDFSRYLEGNFTGIAEEETIPFDKELEHTRAYLAVEQACHEGGLSVEFDTPVTFFRIPPLTLQPIVENAVKHGLDPELEPLHVTVATRDADGGVRIFVDDNGPGYAPAAGERSFALDNVRERLGAKCGGTLEIGAREGGGTRVTMFIPGEGGALRGQ